MTTRQTQVTVIDGQKYYPLENPDQLPQRFGDAEHFIRAGVRTRFVRVADNTWVVHRDDRPGSTGVLVRTEVGFVYSASARTDTGLPGWRILPQSLAWRDFLRFYEPEGDTAPRG